MMPKEDINATISGGALDGNRMRIRFGSDQKDGDWHLVEVEIAGRMLPLNAAIRFLNYPEAK